MSHSRFNALETILHRTDLDVEYVDVPSQQISSFFGSNVFSDKAMKQYLPEEAYIGVKAAIQSGSNLDRNVADVVAAAMKKWAMEKGATHFAHWFQPLTGKTAEKHDSFFNLDNEGNAIEEFGGDELAQQEPDGSSFPGGGLRSTFEARGYTAWDPTSPAFILEVGEGKTLCIPTIFVTYSGDALDYKLPLLKSQHYLEEAAIEVLKYFNIEANKVTPTLGWEQEYFLVDEALFNARPDLVMCGRTLVGKHSPKGQQLDDHYFGSIPERVYAFMRDFETECHKLGIPVRTRHNEVGPGQYEVAPRFEELNVAVDHNQLLMDIMDRVAIRHKLRVLLHEKPFAGVNGSGKHNNWSLSTNTGINLLAPGKNPGKNLRFLTFFVNTIQAVYQYADLLRASIATASNDHRLGANEAPPAIVSVFIGKSLTKVLEDIEMENGTDEEMVAHVLDLLSKIPNLSKDNTDRNRTSPFAFTGNKFEIRMVGSSANCAAPMTIMNAIVGVQLKKFKEEVDGLIGSGMESDSAILSVIQRYVKESKVIRFEGDGYSKDWEKESEKRGLSNFPNTPDALDAYLSKKSLDLFERTGILSSVELRAHHEVMLENYVLTMQLESRTLGEICYNHIIPAAIEYQTKVADNVDRLMDIGFDENDLGTQFDILKRINKSLQGMRKAVKSMSAERLEAASMKNTEGKAKHYCDKVKPFMVKLRKHADRLEYLVDDRYWPLVKYRELMFIR